MSSADRSASHEKFTFAHLMATDPLKHYVRMRVWLPSAKTRYEKTVEQNGIKRGLRYLTLCGAEAIDVFHLYKNGLLAHNERLFPDVFFVEYNDEAFLDASRLLSGRGLQGRFEELVLRPSDLLKEFPFDLINLDFTGVCIPRNEPPFSDTLRAIEKIFYLQGERNFTLLVTFKADRSRENDEAVGELVQVLEENIGEYLEYSDIYGQKFASKPRALSAGDYKVFLCTAIPKLVLSLGFNQGFEGSMEGVCYYSRTTKSRKYDIVKFAFSFDRPIAKTIREKTRIAKDKEYRYKRAVCSALKADQIDAEQSMEKEGTTDQVKADLKEVLELRERMDRFLPHA
jgi:hypothetical protein